jgi:hypothetical protein
MVVVWTQGFRIQSCFNRWNTVEDNFYHFCVTNNVPRPNQIRWEGWNPDDYSIKAVNHLLGQILLKLAGNVQNSKNGIPLFLMNPNENICIKWFLSFLTVRIFHGSKLTRFLFCLALNMWNSDQLKFLTYLVRFWVRSFYIFNSACQQCNYIFRKFQVFVLQNIIKRKV